jgi:glycosyltransferase involved in cell wall biosynthesis
MSTPLIDSLAFQESRQRPADKNPLVSVVLGTYNRLQLLQHTISNIRQESHRLPREIIVIDGGSTDGTIDWLVQQKDVLTILQHNRGQDPLSPGPLRSWGYFMNLGFKVAQGKYVLMISDDCVLLPGSLEQGIQQYERELRRAKVGGIAFYFRNWPDEERYYVQRTLGGKLMVNHGLFLRQALADVGWVEEEYYAFYKADGDLSLKIWDHGYTILEGHQSYVEHYMDPNELVRLQNNQTHDEDAERYRSKWKLHTALTKLTKNMGKFYVDYVDPDRVADRHFAALAPTSSEHVGLSGIQE